MPPSLHAVPLENDPAADASERMLGIRELAMKNPEYHEGVRQGLADAQAGRVVTLDELFRIPGDQ